MALPKRYTPPRGVSFALCLVLLLLSTGCGGRSLASREIVHAVFFEHQNDNFSVCLLLANQQAGENDPPRKTVSAQGETPAQALQNAENSLTGTAYYGLTDLLVLPADCEYGTACAVGELMYEKAQPAPEISVFLRDGAGLTWDEDADEIYTSLRAVEENEKIHCGLQQLFARENVCTVPCRRADGGYDYAILTEDFVPLRVSGLTASLAAALARQTACLDASFAVGAAAVRSKIGVAAEGESVVLSLWDTQFTVLADVPDPEATLRTELAASYDVLLAYTQATQSDPFAFDFTASVLYGADGKENYPRLSVLFG